MEFGVRVVSYLYELGVGSYEIYLCHSYDTRYLVFKKGFCVRLLNHLLLFTICHLSKVVDNWAANYSS